MYVGLYVCIYLHAYTTYFRIPVSVNEFVGPKWRAFSSNMYFISWCVGYMVLAGLAYFIREWRVLMVVSCLPELIFYIIFYL